MGKQRNKPATKKVPERGIPTVLDTVNEWREFLICNHYLPRVKYTGEGQCEGCGVRQGPHEIPCKMELCPSCMTIAWECHCESWSEPDIVCEV